MSRILTDEPQYERDALRPLANGKLLAFGRFVLGIVVTVLVAYYSAQAAITERLTRVETLQQSNFQEVLRSLDRIQADITRLRDGK
jgi:hypothetical protein